MPAVNQTTADTEVSRYEFWSRYKFGGAQGFGAPLNIETRIDEVIMFGKGIQLPFRLMGIPVVLDWSFLLILPLLAYIIGANAPELARQFGIPGAEALGETSARYVLGFIAAIGLFVCVILHELGHAVTARYYGVDVREITLWFLGGVAQLREMPQQRGAEAVVAIVGPIVSFAIAAVLWLVLQVVPPAATGTFFVIAYLAMLNVILAVFNLLPALPLDGGRVLRSLLALKMSHLQATQIAAGTSKFLAIALGIFGLLGGGIFLIFIAFFIYIAVNSEMQYSLIVQMLRGIRVRDLMSRDVQTVPPEMTVAELTQRMLRERHLGFPVIDHDGSLVGVVTLRDLHKASPDTRVREVMSPEPRTIPEDAPAVEAFRQMSQNNFGRLIVLGHDGLISGIVTTTDLMKTIQVRTLGLQWNGRQQAAGERWAGELTPRHA